MKIVKLNAGQFDKFATCHRYRNYFQSSMYANVMVKFGYNAKFLGFATPPTEEMGQGRGNRTDPEKVFLSVQRSTFIFPNRVFPAARLQKHPTAAFDMLRQTLY